MSSQVTNNFVCGKVCQTWRHHSLAPSLWQTLSERAPWRLSKEGCVAQLERWKGNSTDWRQVFVERYKLRRAWMGGQCHVRTFEVRFKVLIVVEHPYPLNMIILKIDILYT